MDLTQLANLGEFIGGLAVVMTLIYLAVQVRQGALAQQHTNELAQADAIYKSGESFGAFRSLLTDRDTNVTWLKARNDEDLTPEEEHLLFVVLAELTYSALAAMATMHAVGDGGRAGAIPGVVVREMRQSRTLHRIWTPLAGDLEAYGFADFAAAVRQQIEPGSSREA